MNVSTKPCTKTSICFHSHLHACYLCQLGFDQNALLIYAYILLCTSGCIGKQIDVTKVINKPGVLTIGMYMEMNHLEPNNYCHDPPYTIYAITKGDWYKT